MDEVQKEEARREEAHGRIVDCNGLLDEVVNEIREEFPEVTYITLGVSYEKPQPGSEEKVLPMKLHRDVWVRSDLSVAMQALSLSNYMDQKRNRTLHAILSGVGKLTADIKNLILSVKTTAEQPIQEDKNAAETDKNTKEEVG